MFHNDYADILGWYGHDASDFDSEEVFEFVANVQMYDYAIYKKRLASGEKLNVSNVKQNIEFAKRKKRILSFFKKIYCKNK